MEAALQQAVDEGRIQLPLINVDFRHANNELLKPIDGRVTSLTVPHRLADAILRDSVVTEDGDDKDKLFRDSSYAERWRKASTANATPIYELCPTALLFGMWGAPEKPGGLGAKFQRCITSEIVGVDAVFNESRQGLRRDPLGIVRNATVAVEEDGQWTNIEESAKGGLRPSEINHGPILFGPTHGGITFQDAEQTVVLTLAGLRWLRFPPEGAEWEEPSEEQKRRDSAGRVVLAAIGLCGAALAEAAGHDLRSGCLLHATEPAGWELLDQPGEANSALHVDADAAVEILKGAVTAAEEAGLTWRKERLLLKPSEKLVELIQRSQKMAKEKGQEGE
jgi:CRISPR-associated protein Csb1